MRDEKRIDQILGLIRQLWKQYPDLRFNQLVYTLQSEFSQANKGIGRVEGEGADGIKRLAFDLFYLEDDKFLEYLNERLSRDD